MRRINRHNYETFFLDYIEGSLDHDLINELEQFLLLNPDLKEELDKLADYEKPEPDIIKYTKKYNLKVTDINLSEPINKDNIHTYFIALYEKDLKNEQISELNSYINSNSQLEKTNKLFENIHLKPDKSIKFKHKQNLYVRTINKLDIKHLLYIISSAAAVIILFLLFYPARNIQSLNTYVQTKIETKNSIIQPLTKEKEIQYNSIAEINIKKKKTAIKSQVLSVEVINDPVLSSRGNSNLEKINRIPFKGFTINSKNQILACINTSSPAIEEINEKETHRLSLHNPIDYNHDKKINYWELIKAASNTINKITTDDLISFEFTDKGKLTEFALKNDIFKISKN